MSLLRPRLLIIATASLLVMGAISPQLASAHVLKEDNGITGVLHIAPDDNPKSGELTELEISFGDAKNVFNLQNCGCLVIVKSANKTLLSTPLAPSLDGTATLDGKASVTFPTAGVYDVILKGVPKDGSFPTFSLDYLVRVTGDSDVAVANNSLEVGAISVASLVLLAMIGFTAIKLGGRYTKTEVKASKHQQPKQSRGDK